MSPIARFDQPGTYRILVQGPLEKRWQEYFEEMMVEVEMAPDGTQITRLTGIVEDQAALQGILQKLYTLGLPLLFAEKID